MKSKTNFLMKVLSFVLALSVIFTTSQINLSIAYAAESLSTDKIIDDSDDSVSYNGGCWSTVKDEKSKNGKSHQNIKGSKVYNIANATLSFYGTSVKVYGKKGTDFGKAAFTVFDEKFNNEVDNLAAVSEVSGYSETTKYESPYISFVGLELGNHKLKIVAEDLIDIDYFEVSTDKKYKDSAIESIECKPVTMKKYDAVTLNYTMKTSDGSYVCKKPDIKSKDDDIVKVQQDRGTTKIKNDPGILAMEAGNTSIDVTYDDVTVNVPITVKDIVRQNNLRRVVDREHIMYLENYYWGDDLSGSSVVKLWSTVPDSMKPYTVILLIAERSITDRRYGLENGYGRESERDKEYLSSKDWIKNNVEICNVNRIPCAVQAVNGETGMGTIPIEWYDELAKNNEYLHGYNGAEMYNAGFSRGNDYKNYMTQLTRVCVENGLHLMWTDTNMNTINQWLQTYDPLSNIFRENKQNIIMQNKQSFNDPSSEALYKGLWLTNYCDNWGVASDW